MNINRIGCLLFTPLYLDDALTKNVDFFVDTEKNLLVPPSELSPVLHCSQCLIGQTNKSDATNRTSQALLQKIRGPDRIEWISYQVQPRVPLI